MQLQAPLSCGQTVFECWERTSKNNRHAKLSIGKCKPADKTEGSVEGDTNYFEVDMVFNGKADGSVAKLLPCWTQAQKGLSSNRSRNTVG